MHDIKIICAISLLPETGRTSTDTDPLMSVSILDLFKDSPHDREYKKLILMAVFSLKKNPATYHLLPSMYYLLLCTTY